MCVCRDTESTEIYACALHDALPISPPYRRGERVSPRLIIAKVQIGETAYAPRFSPPYRWAERVYYTLFLLQYGGKFKVSGMHTGEAKAL